MRLDASGCVWMRLAVACGANEGDLEKPGGGRQVLGVDTKTVTPRGLRLDRV